MTIGLAPRGRGVLRMVDGKPGHLLHWCEPCGCAHMLDVHALSHDGKTVGWDGDFLRPSLGEPVRHDKDGAICEYILRGGVLFYLESCTHSLRGQSRHLIEFP